MEEMNKDENLQPNVEAPKSVFDRVTNFVAHNSKLVSWVSIGAVLIVVIAYFGINYYTKSQAENKEKAATALSRVLPLYQAKDAESIQKALYGDPSTLVRNEPVIGLIDIINRYDGTPQAKLASLYAANLLVLTNKNDEAEKYFKIALKADSKLVLEGAYAGLGAIAESRGKFEDAVSSYKKAVDNYTNYASKNRYEYYMGLCFEKLGKKEDAEKIYRSIIGENKTYDFIGRAKAGLVRLGTIIE